MFKVKVFVSVLLLVVFAGCEFEWYYTTPAAEESVFVERFDLVSPTNNLYVALSEESQTPSGTDFSTPPVPVRWSEHTVSGIHTGKIDYHVYISLELDWQDGLSITDLTDLKNTHTFPVGIITYNSGVLLDEWTNEEIMDKDRVEGILTWLHSRIEERYPDYAANQWKPFIWSIIATVSDWSDNGGVSYVQSTTSRRMYLLLGDSPLIE